MKIETTQSNRHKMVELKARVSEHDSFRKKLSALGAEYLGTFQQTDLYFKVPQGRLKLREVNGYITSELIYYERENIAGPKRDDAFLLKIQKSEKLKKILKKILKPLVEIEKTREIYRHQGTQIHLDTVKTLGKFVEFERQTTDDLSVIENDQSFLEKLLKTFEIDPKNLEMLSYSDLAEALTIK